MFIIHIELKKPVKSSVYSATSIGISWLSSAGRISSLHVRAPSGLQMKIYCWSQNRASLKDTHDNRSFCLREFTAVIIPPQADIDAALKELYGHLCKQETVHPDTAFFITRDFNKADLRTIAPKFFQHISCNTHGERTLDHCYFPFRNAFKSLPRPLLGKSDHWGGQSRQ